MNPAHQTPEQTNPQTATQIAPAPFIVGTGRCGTTLLRLMLDAHPALAIPPETHFIPLAVRACARAASPAQAFLRVLLSHRTWTDFHLDRARFEAGVHALDPFQLGEALRVFYRTYASRYSKPRWGDKTPIYSSHMPLIQEWLPEARFIHLLRDGRDVALSVKEVWFGPKGLSEAAEWWANGILEARYHGRQLSHYLEVRYEDLVEMPEQTLRTICRFVDLPYDPIMLDYHRTSARRLDELGGIGAGESGPRISVEERKNIHRYTSQPPNRERLARWKKEMPPAECRLFEEIAGDILDSSGYEVSNKHQLNPARRPPLWIEQVHLAREELARVIPAGCTVLLVNQAEWEPGQLGSGRHAFPFPHRSGEYWGLPTDDQSALRELLVCQRTATHIAFGWPSFWWFTHYPTLARYLQEECRCLLDNSRMKIFRLPTGGLAQASGDRGAIIHQ